MKVIISSITQHLFEKQFEEFESQHQINLEKIILDPQNPKNPDWLTEIKKITKNQWSNSRRSHHARR